MPRKHRKRETPWGFDATERESPKNCPTVGKRMYSSEEEARATASHQMRQQPVSLQLRTYHCLYCGAWHLTSKER